MVLANAYEEDLAVIKALPPEQRNWKIDIKADPNDIPDSRQVRPDRQHHRPDAALGGMMGSLDNTDGRLSIGQFITATINLPPDPTWWRCPPAALIEDGDGAWSLSRSTPSEHEFTRRQVMVVRRGRELAYHPLAARRRPSAAKATNRCMAGAARDYFRRAGTVAAQLDDLKARRRSQAQSHLPMATSRSPPALKSSQKPTSSPADSVGCMVRKLIDWESGQSA